MHPAEEDPQLVQSVSLPSICSMRAPHLIRVRLSLRRWYQATKVSDNANGDRCYYILVHASGRVNIRSEELPVPTHFCWSSKRGDSNHIEPLPYRGAHGIAKSIRAHACPKRRISACHTVLAIQYLPHGVSIELSSARCLSAVLGT